jgi:hypothetical protein
MNFKIATNFIHLWLNIKFYIGNTTLSYITSLNSNNYKILMIFKIEFTFNLSMPLLIAILSLFIQSL